MDIDINEVIQRVSNSDYTIDCDDVFFFMIYYKIVFFHWLIFLIKSECEKRRRLCFVFLKIIN